MKPSCAWVVIGGVLQACGAPIDDELTRAGGSREVVSRETAQQDGGREGQTANDAPNEGGCGDTCGGDAELDFHVFGDGLSAWEGRRVVAAAVTNHVRDDGSYANERPVLLFGSIQDGAFSLFCPRSLSENYSYPSWAVFADLDGDGRCSTYDLGYRMQLYGWEANVNEEVAAAAWQGVPSMGPPIGSSAADFCAGYFP